MSHRVVFHVLHKADHWEIRKEKNKTAIQSFLNKQAAIDKARKLAKSQKLSQLKIHKKSGAIQTEFTYGKDPSRTLG
jgi:hypothetical protein